MTFLDNILLSTRETIQTSKRKRPVGDLKYKIRDVGQPRNFTNAICRSKHGALRLVAEIKKASPSQGVLRQPFKPIEIAKVYEEGGAAALSILTEGQFFLGSLEHVSQIHSAVRLPLLRKDFLIDEYQIYEARAAEADAVLLIVKLLDDYQLKDYLDISDGLDMSCLVEVHTEEEVERALKSSARLIGINNRDLRTFKTDLETTFTLAKRILHDRIVVSESGISDRQDINRLAEANLDAVLIGETFMKSPDIRDKIQELFGES